MELTQKDSATTLCISRNYKNFIASENWSSFAYRTIPPSLPLTQTQKQKHASQPEQITFVQFIIIDSKLDLASTQICPLPGTAIEDFLGFPASDLPLSDKVHGACRSTTLPAADAW